MPWQGLLSISVSDSGDQQVDPSGSYWPWKACAIGEQFPAS